MCKVLGEIVTVLFEKIASHLHQMDNEYVTIKRDRKYLMRANCLFSFVRDKRGDS